MPKTMTVRVSLIVEVDVAAWEAAYGVPFPEQREDVPAYILGTVQGSAAADEGAITSVRRPKPRKR